MLTKKHLIIGLLMCILLLCGCGSDNAATEKLYRAVEAGDLSETKSLLKDGAKLSLEDCKVAQEEAGDSRILGAALEMLPTDEDICRALIDGGADLNSLNEEGASYLQILIDTNAQTYSAEKTYLQVMKDLLKAGADVNLTGKGDYKGTALDYLMSQSPITTHYYEDMYQLLLSYGAEVTEDTFQACMKSDSRFLYADQLLKKAEKEDSSFGLSPMLRALIEKKPEKEVLALLEQEEYKKKEENNLVFFSAATGSPKLMKTLEKKGFDVTQSTAGGLSLLDLASLYNNPAMMEYLLSQGADLEDFDDCGYEAAEKDEEDLVEFQRITEAASYTPLSLALTQKRMKNAEYLLSKGADFQRSAWCIASLYGNKKAIDFLLEQGYEADDYFIFQSYLYSSEEMITYMLEKGVDHNVHVYGNTVLDELKETGNQARYDVMVKCLEDASSTQVK